MAPNLVHLCRFIWEWIYAKQIAPRDTKGIWGILRGQTFKSQGKLSNGWTDWHQIWYTSVDSSGNGHSLKTIRPTIPQGGILGGFMGSTIQNTVKCGQTAGPIGNKFCTCKMQMTLGMGTGRTNLTQRHNGEHSHIGLSRGNFWGFRGVNISSKVWGMP